MVAASGGPERGMDVPGTPPQLRPGMRWRRVFPGEERQLGELRRWLASLLPDCPARDDVALVATELGSNAVLHTGSGRGGWFAVEITWHERVTRVAVADSGGPSEPQVTDDPAADHGRGLLLVHGLSIRTGTCGDNRGRMVWADVPWGGAAPAGPATAGDSYEAAIRGEEDALARCFAGVPAWFGRSTLRWWALPESGGLVSAPSARELAALLYRRPGAERTPGALGPGQTDSSTGERRGVRREQEAGIPPPHADPGARTGPARPGHDDARDERWRSPGTAGGNPGPPQAHSGKPRSRAHPGPAGSSAA
jgi:serine/threonine-protein kinase RsbW